MYHVTSNCLQYMQLVHPSRLHRGKGLKSHWWYVGYYPVAELREVVEVHIII